MTFPILLTVQITLKTSSVVLADTRYMAVVKEQII